MPDGGKLTIETANVFLDQPMPPASRKWCRANMCMLAITDSGAGMTPEVQARAFDPFFTTKDVGQGTGLGLSQVYGFVKQSRGHVKIYSEAAKAPRSRSICRGCTPSRRSKADRRSPRPVRGRANETILVVEDDEDVRASTTEMLRDLGYTILEAANGAAACSCSTTIRKSACCSPMSACLAA